MSADATPRTAEQLRASKHPIDRHPLWVAEAERNTCLEAGAVAIESLAVLQKQFGADEQSLSYQAAMLLTTEVLRSFYWDLAGSGPLLPADQVDFVKARWRICQTLGPLLAAAEARVREADAARANFYCEYCGCARCVEAEARSAVATVREAQAK